MEGGHGGRIFASEDEEAQYHLRFLRDGTSEQKIRARAKLAAIFERRGMLEEAVELHESNARAGVRERGLYTRLYSLYRKLGRDDDADAAMAEAARLMPPSQPPDAPTATTAPLVERRSSADEPPAEPPAAASATVTRPVPAVASLADHPGAGDDAKLVEEYGKLLTALLGDAGTSGARRATVWPEALLPAAPEELADALGRVRASTDDPPEHERLDAMTGLLERFGPNKSHFVGTIISVPAAISLGYALWLGFRGEGWWWLLAAAGTILGSFGVLTLKFATPTSPPGSRFRLAAFILKVPLDLVFLVGSAALWIRLAVIGGVYGLYQSIAMEFSLWGMALAVLALVVAFHYSKALNTLYHFAWWWRPRRR